MQSWSRSSPTKWLAISGLTLLAGVASIWAFRQLRRTADESFDEVWTDRNPDPSLATEVEVVIATEAPLVNHAPVRIDRRRVRDVMTPNPETIEYDADIASAAEKMRSTNVGVLPVVAGGQLAGIITDRDLAMAVADRDDESRAIRVDQLMSSVPITVSPEASLEDAADLMAGNQIRRLPVVEGPRLVGILSLGDLAASGANQAATEALEEISEPSEPRR